MNNFFVFYLLFFYHKNMSSLLNFLFINILYFFYFRYSIALGFKLIGRCRTKENAIQMNSLFNIFIDNLDLSSNNKEKIKKDIQNNWMCNEWCMQFIDAGRLPINDEFFWTTNNYTERINRTIEATYSGKQTVLTFVERLYGMTLTRENLVENHTGKLIHEAGLVTTFNAQSVEQVNNI
jgi:hypothetical protein